MEIQRKLFQLWVLSISLLQWELFKITGDRIHSSCFKKKGNVIRAHSLISSDSRGIFFKKSCGWSGGTWRQVETLFCEALAIAGGSKAETDALRKRVTPQL
jgi:hypothetical protein